MANMLQSIMFDNMEVVEDVEIEVINRMVYFTAHGKFKSGSRGRVQKTVNVSKYYNQMHCNIVGTSVKVVFSKTGPGKTLKVKVVKAMSWNTPEWKVTPDQADFSFELESFNKDQVELKIDGRNLEVNAESKVSKRSIFRVLEADPDEANIYAKWEKGHLKVTVPFKK